MQENMYIIRKLQDDIPQYHTRAMRANYLHTYDLLLPKIKPALLRMIYHKLTGDILAAESTNEAKVDACIKLVLELGDPNITTDLREYNEGRPEKYNTFWNKAAIFLAGKASDLVTAVDERRHDQIVHLATAISINDLL